jgi:hypothetical protein
MGEEGGSPEDFAVIDDLLRADRAASRVHDYLYDLNGVTRVEANAAIWEIHEVLRPLIDPSGRAWTTPGRTAEGGDDAAVRTPEEQT